MCCQPVCPPHTHACPTLELQAGLGEGVERELLRGRWLDDGGHSTRDALALAPDVTIPLAARHALAQSFLWEPSSAEVEEEVLCVCPHPCGPERKPKPRL